MKAAKLRDTREWESAEVLADAFRDQGHVAFIDRIDGQICIIVDQWSVGAVFVFAFGELGIDPMSSKPEVLRDVIKKIGLGGALLDPVVTGLDVVIDRDDHQDVSFLRDYRGKNAEEREADEARLEAFYAGEWYMVYIRVEAEVEVGPIKSTVRSSGIGGVESDSPDYHKELAQEEYDDLADKLHRLGVKDIPPLEEARW